ncbi:putative peptide transport permease protein [Austwickia sp. TVS 96-490-7B]|uniref:ABC transporter permease n=1 Tax=Austwickia sp. TVS 96-490-7B TaxID=2830843 RepID=UPI001C578C8B|nr:ABC transporter permease [Austwickia sp. TVS 96-490-7B]MBW3085997.1 putative peptide transport permease protein [Austwickia sp. TVS 96-490-7B]
MIKYILRRLANYVVMIFVATSIAYFAAVNFMRPENRLLERTPRPTFEQVKAQLRANGLDPELSATQRYLDWLKGVVLHFDWGMGPDGSRINDEFFMRALISGRLVLLATLLSIVLGISLGVFAASRQYKLSDRVVTTLSYIISCIPAPVTYLMVQMTGIGLNERSGGTVVYVTGMRSPIPPEGTGAHMVDELQHLILPTIALTIVGYVSYQMLQRTLLLDNINADYVRTARAKGLTKSQAVRKHALRTSFIPVAQSIAFQIPLIFTGTFIIETVFAWQGLGRYTLDAITMTQSVNAAVAGVAFGGVMFAIGAILADLSVAVVDPRVRVS